MLDLRGSGWGRRVLRILVNRNALNAIASAALVCAVHANARAQSNSILYFEQLGKLVIEQAAGDLPSQHAQPSGATLAFYAFGRQFNLALERNDRLTRGLAGSVVDRTSAVVLYRGVVVGQAESWVRLAQHGSVLTGAISDGIDVYAIEPYDRVAPFLVSPSGATGETIIYRLKDTAERAGDHVFEPLSLAGGLAKRMAAKLATATITFPGAQIDVALIADAELAAREGTGTEGLLLNAANIVDGIFGQQIGIHLNVVELDIHETEPDPFTSADPPTLLNELAAYKESTPTLRGLGLVHLFTGRNLADGGDSEPSVVGIANLGSLCDPEFSVSLTEMAGRGYVAAALIAAHEIGHNFGAPHDATPGSACASTPATYLMASLLNGSDQFSDCSVDQMRTELAAATCLTTVPPNDLSIGLGVAPAPEIPAGKELTGSVSVTNPGPNDAFGVEVLFETSGVDVFHPNGLCSSSSAGSVCTLYRVPAGESRSVSFFGFGEQPGRGTIAASVISWNDPNPSNDRLAFDIDFLPSVQFETLTRGASPDKIRPGETTEISWEFVNIGRSPATDVVLDITISTPLEPLAFSPPGGGTCIRGPAVSNWLCSVAAVPRDEPQRLVISARAPSDLTPPSGSYISSTLIFRASSATEAILGSNGLSTTSVYIASTIADLALEMEAPETPVPGSRIAVVLTGRNNGPDTATNASLELFNGGSAWGQALAIDSIESERATCAIDIDGNVACALNALPSGESFTVTIGGVAATERSGGYPVQAHLESNDFDPQAANHHVYGSIHPTAAPPPPPDPVQPPPAPPASQGGGGGAMDLSSLLALFALLAAQFACGGRAKAARRTGTYNLYEKFSKKRLP